MSTAKFPHRPGVSDGFLTKVGVTVLADPERQRIPYHDIEGNPTDHFRDRFKTPVPGIDGKTQRYSQRVGSGMHAYIPPIPLTKGEDLYVTEANSKPWHCVNPDTTPWAFPAFSAIATAQFYPVYGKPWSWSHRRQFISSATPTRC
jgi:hypothetical protein